MAALPPLPQPGPELAAVVRTELERVGLPVLAEVLAERDRQDAKWGEQNHPDGTGPDVVWSTHIGPATAVAETAKAATDEAAAAGALTWRHIATEELAEAFAEDDEDALRTELIQTAAVCVQWAQAIDRRRTNRQEPQA